MYRFGLFKLSLIVLGFAAFPVFAQSEADYKAVKSQVEALKGDVDALKKQQAAILEQLTQLKSMLGQQQAPSNPVIDLKDAPVTGAATAKVGIVEFTDYWCGFCARFARQTLPEIMKRYVETGKVRYYLRDFAAQRGPKVAEAALCAGSQDKYWALHDKLFTNFGKYSDEELDKYETEAGADPTLVKKCVDSGRYSKLVAAGMEAGQAAGVSGTPTFMIGVIDPADPTKLKTERTVVGAQSIEQFQTALDEVLAQAK